MTAARELLARAASALLDERRQLTMDELAELAALPNDHTAALAAVAHEVRLAWCGPMVEVEGILSVKTGGCSEDCSFCSQSAKFDSPVKATPLLSIEEVVQAAEETKATGATEFCLVLALRGPDEKVMRWLEEVTPIIVGRTGMQVAVSAGVLDEDQAARLRRAGVHRYNHNLETAQSFFGRIVTTHTWEERFETCKMIRAEGMELCCGVLFGMGESDAQRLELIGQLREVEPAEVPVNFLNPRPGTPLSERPLVSALDAIKWIALLRLALPTVILRLAGGREVTLRDLQAMGMTSGINALIVGNYLTTLGRSPEQDLQMLEDLKMPVGALSAAL